MEICSGMHISGWEKVLLLFRDSASRSSHSNHAAHRKEIARERGGEMRTTESALAGVNQTSRKNNRRCEAFDSRLRVFRNFRNEREEKYPTQFFFMIIINSGMRVYSGEKNYHQPSTHLHFMARGDTRSIYVTSASRKRGVLSLPFARKLLTSRTLPTQIGRACACPCARAKQEREREGGSGRTRNSKVNSSLLFRCLTTSSTAAGREALMGLVRREDPR